MKTRKQYLDHECTHSEFYGQFVTPQVKAILLRYIPLESILSSKNENFNDIPLARWDMLTLPPFLHGKSMQDAGDFLTLAGKNCIFKEAARQIKEEKNQTANA